MVVLRGLGGEGLQVEAFEVQTRWGPCFVPAEAEAKAVDGL
jgi:hypothetical protein